MPRKTDAELRKDAKWYIDAWNAHRQKPWAPDYKKNEVFRNIAHVHAARYEGLATQDAYGTWIPVTDLTEDGKPVLNTFLAFDKACKAYHEIKRRAERAELENT